MSMAALIKGISVILYEKVQVGEDAFSAPVYEERPVVIDNVLVSPAGTGDLVGEAQLHGKRVQYDLCIPKGDTHNWENARVEFFGHVWETVGFVQEWIEGNLPLDWNRKVKVERYV